MFLIKTGADLISFLNNFRQKNKTLGFVPTMGALHEGHFSLLTRSKVENDVTICSIFVNPSQFNNKEDLENYPRPVTSDIQSLSEQNLCDVVFMPSATEMYPEGDKINEIYQLGHLSSLFEGKYRPGHFQGVAHIVNQFLELIKPNRLYMGQKDYQQCLVIGQLIKEKKHPVQLVNCPTEREQDGLAMSSRNRLLTSVQKSRAALIYQCLVSIQAQKHNQNLAKVQKECFDLLNNKGLKPDYIALANADTLEPMTEFNNSKKMVALIAASIGSVRLIDNLII